MYTMNDLYGEMCPTGYRENALSDADRGKLVEGVMAWCRKQARDAAKAASLAGRSIDVEDLESEAFIAAVCASKVYDPTTKNKFLTVAAAWVKTHLRMILDPRRTVRPGQIGAPELVTARDDGDEAEPYDPNKAELRTLRSIKEPARSIVRMVIFGDLTPDQVAVQLGMEVKDVKLHLRNAAESMTGYEKRQKDVELNGLFRDYYREVDDFAKPNKVGGEVLGGCHC